MFDRRDGARRGKAEDGAEIGIADLRGNRAKFGDSPFSCMRLNTTPVSASAGLKVIETSAPE
jgi:hypothetical protein